MATIRGHGLVTINDWLFRKFNDSYSDFISNMRPPVADTLCNAQTWARYPVEYLAEIYNDICCHLKNGTSKAKILDDLGNSLAQADLTEEPAINLKTVPVSGVLGRIPWLWYRYRDCGNLQILKINDNENYAELMLSGCACGPMHFDVTSAWIEGVLGSLCNRKFRIAGQFYPVDSYYWKVTWR